MAIKNKLTLRIIEGDIFVKEERIKKIESEDADNYILKLKYRKQLRKLRKQRRDIIGNSKQ